MPGGRAVAAAVLAATMAAGFAVDTEFAAEPLHESAGDGLMENPRGSTMKIRLKALRVAAVSASAVVSFAVTESAQAQQPAAVQWRVEDGGNGHWYQLVTLPGEIRATWDRGDESARERGGYLVTINTDIENAFVSSNFRSRMIDPWSCWIGGFLAANCEWRWVTGEPFDCAAMPVTTYPDWTCPRDCYEDRLYTGSFGDDVYLCIDNHMSGWQGGKRQMLIEWSADCNSDGIVDYGQILAGNLADTNSNGIPDLCELPTCIDADLNPNGIVDGADLGAMLAFWGPVSPAFPRADINGDGTVNGADLGILLSLWGPCGG
jgi:hypothetical protein